MIRFNSKIGAGLLVGLSLVYMIASLVTGRSAKADYPPDLNADVSQTGVGVWQAANMIVKNPGAVSVVDVRDKSEFARYHVPGSINEPGASAQSVAELAKGKSVIVIAKKDEEADQLVGPARKASGNKNVFYLKGGAGSWFLALDLPVPLFSEKEIPIGYEAAIATVRSYFNDGAKPDAAKVSKALGDLSRFEYEPTLLGQKKKPKASGKRKKISGGCG